ncbi:hypothetical protein Tco_0758973 [Tanacetum coccineum]
MYTPQGSCSSTPNIVGMLLLLGLSFRRSRRGLRQAYECLASATHPSCLSNLPYVAARDCEDCCSLMLLIHLTSAVFSSRVHAVSFDAAVLNVAATVSAAAGYIVSAGICDAAGSFDSWSSSIVYLMATLFHAVSDSILLCFGRVLSRNLRCSFLLMALSGSADYVPCWFMFSFFADRD